MSIRGRSYTFLTEMLLALLFFSVSAAVLVQMFVRAEQESRRTALRTAALISAQSMLEEAAAGGEPCSVLFETDGMEYTVTVTVEEERTKGGTVRRAAVTAEDADGEPILSVPMETAVFSGE